MSLLSKIFGDKEHQGNDKSTNLSDSSTQENVVSQPKVEEHSLSQDSDRTSNSSIVSESEGSECQPERESATTSVENNNGDAPDTAEKKEVDTKELAFRRFLYMEADYKYQEISEREHLVVPRSNSEHVVTFRQILTMLYPDVVTRYTGKAMVSKRTAEAVSTDRNLNAEAFLDHSPFMFLFHRNEDGTSTVFDESVTLSMEFKGNDNHNYFTHIVVKPIGSTEKSVYARVSVLQSAEVPDDLITTRSASLPSVMSFIMIYDVLDPAEDLKVFNEIEQAAVQKVKERQPLTEREDELMRGMSGMSYPGYNMGFGKWLLDNQRFYDAYVTFQRVYTCLKPEMHHLPKEMQDMFYRACYAMGICLQQLGFLDKAAYFLQLAIVGGEEYIAPYVEILALGNHNRVCYFMNQLRSQAASNPAAAKEVQRLEKVTSEAENNHQVADSFDMGVLPLGYVLRHMFDADRECVLGASISPMNGDEAQGKVLTSREEIWNTNLLDIQDSVIYLRYSRAFVEMGVETDRSFLCQNNCLLLNIQSVTAANGSPYVRINAMLPNFSQNDEKKVPGPFNIPRYASFIVGKEPVLQQFKRSDLKAIFDAAIKLKNSYRTIEAMRAFEYIHNALKIEYTKVSATDEDEELFFDATYELGFCLVELGCYERASYYLDWAQEGYKADYAREYVNCLCNNGDVRALNIIEGIMANMKKPEESEFQEAYEHFFAFLQRRKAFVLTNTGKLKEAETLLTEMLENPLSKEYAQRELQFIQNLKK